jgi:hypothetical protein
MSTSDPIAADADVAARYLSALLSRGVANTDAVSLTASYMTGRAIVAGQQTPPRPTRGPLQS